MAISDERKVMMRTHIGFLSTVIKEMQAEFGKQILSLSSGVLALSVAFIKNVVNVATAQWIWLIYGSWVCLMMAIALTLAAMRMSASGNKTYKAALEDMLAKDAEVDTPASPAEIWMPRFVMVAGLSFALGFVGIVCFSIANLHKDRVMSNNSGSTTATHDFGKPATTHVGDSVEVQRLPPAPAPSPAPAAPKPAEPQEKK